MKRVIVFVVVLTMFTISVPWLRTVHAEQASQDQPVISVVFKIGVPYYVVNLQTPGVKMDVSPFIQNDRTYVPVRFLGNALGVSNENITWDDDSQMATIKGAGATLQMTIGNLWMNVNGDKHGQAMDVTPVLMSSPTWRTFLPARYVAEGLKFQVTWDEATQTVVCWPAGTPEPDVRVAANWLSWQKEEAVTGTSTLNNYQIPINTSLRIDWGIKPNDPNHCEMYLWLDITKEGSWNEAEAILSQGLDNQTVSELMDYARQKTDINQKLPGRYWNSSNGKSSRVSSNFGDTVINITIWSVPQPANIISGN
ncbi:copper amine oxidase N-terminal domain-containing protein [Pelotomaculum terephthalicicum JT]|uniref:copper amine oxidase N-terminal domain-containing protein n=1 Tax=Pelotomaculum TaxID=191373 RepID=UPI0009C8A7A4|nr:MULTISPECIES: copper amine oxidase N-terminal domain-containing protein [Pelotomaculum]MCG9966745.1 copper amine oxidase N-terminal domain-containing protein [Pelotomaculum terephthalicicum JT]OPX85567.1 MAG: hypothetical protein A4E54_02376 [Pelotomaculum sp. PtaB.Bin117]